MTQVQATTPTALPPTFRGAPILGPDETPPEVAGAARAYIVCALAVRAAHAEHGARRDAKPAERRTEAERAELDAAWLRWDRAMAARRDAEIALGRAVFGPRRYYAVRGWLVGFDKRPGKCGYGGHELVVLSPEDKLNPLRDGGSK